MEVQAGTFNPADFSWRGLTMTPAAAAHIRDLMRKQLRIRKGCGWALKPAAAPVLAMCSK